MQRFQNFIATSDELTGILGTPSELAIKKQLSELDRFMQEFIARSPFVLLGTANREGRCDVSPRGDAGAVARVLDSRTLVIPERKGNRRADSLRNILETGRAGLLFLISGMGETLRVNGRARLVRDAEVLDSLVAAGQQPLLAIAVEVEECFFQCAKAVIRSQLWGASLAPTAAGFPCFAEVLAEQTQIAGQTVSDLQEMIDRSYREQLY